MSLKDLLNKIKEVKQFADENVDTGAPETLNARRGRQRQAVEELQRLQTAYTNELRRTSAFIVVIGDKYKEFLEHSSKLFCVEPEAYFKEIVNKIPTHLYLGRESVSNLFDVLGRHIEEKAYALGIVGYPQLIFKQEYQRTIRSTDDFLNIVKEAITDQMGGEIVGIHATHVLTKASIEKNNTSQSTRIVLATGDEKFGIKVANDLHKISNRVFVVVAGELQKPLRNTKDVYGLQEVTKESVDKTLNGIKNLLKKEELAQK